MSKFLKIQSTLLHHATNLGRFILFSSIITGLSLFSSAPIIAKPTLAALPMIQSDSWIRPGLSPEFDGHGMVSLNNNEDIFALAGGDTLNSQHFYHYTFSTGTWTQETDIPCTPGNNADLTYNSTNNKLYAICGNWSQEFYEYDITDDDWTRLDDILQFPIDAMALVSTSSDDIYALHEGTMAHYSISGDNWTDKANYSGSRNYGHDMVYPGSGDYIYAVSPASPADFYRYSISGDSWEQLTDLPGSIANGGGLAYPGTGNYIYSLGDVNIFAQRSFYRYSISGNSWDTLTQPPAVDYEFGGKLVSQGDNDSLIMCISDDTFQGLCFPYSIEQDEWLNITSLPSTVNTASSLSYQENNHYIHTNPGGCAKKYYRYSVDNNSWEAMPDSPDFMCEGSAIEYVNNYAYNLPGDYVDAFYRLEVHPTVDSSWDTLTNPPQTITTGTNIVYPGEGNDIYVTFFGSYFYSYSTTDNIWTRLEDIPPANFWGSSTYGEDGYIYSVEGNNTQNFYRYSISGDSWEQITDTPINITSLNSNLASDGTYIYLSHTGQSALRRYNISSQNWSTTSPFPDSVGEASFVLHPTPDSYYLYVLQGERSDYWIAGGSSTFIFRYTLPLFQVAGLSSTLNVTDTNGNNVETSGDYGFRNENLLVVDSSNNKRIARIDVEVTSNPNWSNVSGQSDPANGRSVIANLISATGTAATHRLYVPINNSRSNSVRICPYATSLNQVTTTCNGGKNFTENSSGSVGGSNITVTRNTINGQEYWVARGIRGSGGISLTPASLLSATGEPIYFVTIASSLGIFAILGVVAGKKIRKSNLNRLRL